MQLTKISITYQETANLGNYSNVKPSVTLEALLESADDPDVVMVDLMSQARLLVQMQVDDALEAQGDAARYSPDVRFDLVTHNQANLTMIVPHGVKVPSKRTYTHTRNHRLAAIRQIAAERLAGERRGGSDERLMDCSNGDLTPALEVIAPVDAELDEQDRKEKEERDRQMAEYQKQQEERRRQYEQQYGSADEEDDEGDDQEDGEF